ncbi:hypothetical protein [Kitasatospora sp. NPDC006786]|uniref:hypothetical protein n=1 Tax=unclassified Kitasatospora TaxID=2633591 RepID=UPI0033E93CA2
MIESEWFSRVLTAHGRALACGDFNEPALGEELDVATIADRAHFHNRTHYGHGVGRVPDHRTDEGSHRRRVVDLARKVGGAALAPTAGYGPGAAHRAVEHMGGVTSARSSSTLADLRSRFAPQSDVPMVRRFLESTASVGAARADHCRAVRLAGRTSTSGEWRTRLVPQVPNCSGRVSAQPAPTPGHRPREGPR